MTIKYTPKKIERLYKEFEKETNLFDLERILGDGSCYGILRKLQRLSEINPDKWDSDRVIEYVRQYYQQHKDEIAERSRKYCQDHKVEIAERKRQYCQDHKVEITERKRQYCQDHKVEIAERRKRYYQQHKDEITERSRQYGQDHKTEIVERSKQYYQDHKAEIAERTKQYYQDHKAEIAERSKQYYQDHTDESAERSKQYKLRRELKMCKIISDIRDIGYEIGKINKNKGTITIELLEEGLDMLLVKKDFEDHVQKAILSSKFKDLYYALQLYYKENNLFISSKPEFNEKERVEFFLGVYALVLKRERK